jgi:hypothetical protein
MPPPTLSALGRARVGNRDARCRLQEGNDAAAPTTPSPDRVRRKGFSPASSPLSSANGRLHQTSPQWRCRGATARPPPRAPPRCRRRKIAQGPRSTVPPRHRQLATAQHPGQPSPEKHPPEDPPAETARGRSGHEGAYPATPWVGTDAAGRTARQRTGQSPTTEFAPQPRAGPHRRTNRRGGQRAPANSRESRRQAPTLQAARPRARPRRCRRTGGCRSAEHRADPTP